MITATAPSNQLLDDKSAPIELPRWQSILAQAITDPQELLEVLHIPDSWLPAARDAARRFPLRVPRGFVSRMRQGDPGDPLLLQVLPLGLELHIKPGFVSDPVGDMSSKVSAGVLQKYQGRALLIATGACAIHCRYCFRQHFPYGEELASSKQWSETLAALAVDQTIDEVILSGGDPLTLNDRRLMQLSDGLQAIPHIKRLRIHTRQPVVLPERVDSGLLNWLDSVPLQKIVVIHANHPQEIDNTVVEACSQLRNRGVTLLNQSVLLKGINDSATTLASLSESLFKAGVLPYYLHMLDRVQGAAHFEVDEQTATGLMSELLALLPGYLVPRLVREIPGHTSKTPVAL